MGHDFVAKFATITNQFILRKRFGPGYRFPRHLASLAVFAESMLHALHLRFLPERPEGAHDAAMMRHVAVPLRRAFPRAHSSQMRWLLRSHMPLIDCVV